MTGALLTTAETAELLGLSPRTVAKLAQDSKLPFVRKLDGVRGGYLFDRSTVEFFNRQRRRKAPAA